MKDVGGGDYQMEIAVGPAFGTATVALEGRPGGDLDGDLVYSDRIAVRSAVASVNVEVRGATEPRRAVVDIAKCNACHDEAGAGIALHGSNRTGEAFSCVVCHNPAGIAAQSDHVLIDETEMGYLEYNFNAWRDYAAITEGKLGAELLLSKPQGIAHAGGQRLGITPESVHYTNILELLDRYDNPVTDCGGQGDFWSGVSFLSGLQTLDKAAVLFAGRRPTTGK